MKQVDLYDLEVGDIFQEDCYSDRWEVIEIVRKKELPGNMVVVAKCLEHGEECDWWYAPSYHGPTIIKE